MHGSVQYVMFGTYCSGPKGTFLYKIMIHLFSSSQYWVNAPKYSYSIHIIVQVPASYCLVLKSLAFECPTIQTPHAWHYNIIIALQAQ